VTSTPEGTAPRGAVPSGTPADHVPGGPGRFGWIFAAVWLFFLYEPFGAAWSSSVPLPWRVVGITALLLFAAGFIGFSAWWRRLRLMDRPRAAAIVWLALAVGVVLLTLAAPSGGVATLAGLVYIAVTGVMNLPLRQGAVVVLGCVLAVLVLPRIVPGWAPSDGAVGSVLLASFAGYGVSQVLERNGQLARAREQLVELAVTRERERMGRDVHDILGHSLTVITVKTELAGRMLETLPATPAADRARAEVADVERLAREALADVRATVSGTREVSLTGELAAARSALAAAGIRADLPGAVDVVPARHRELFAWALREGVTNVVRHSAATRCQVRLTADCVEVRDDGRGPESCDGGGNGLTGLQSRAAKAGGRLEIERSPQGGFLMRVTVAGEAA
jgi:two-component system, NarL family, sensor histidine kinase DesK